MRFAFHKMHGLGNDFVIVDARERPIDVTAPLARAIADRATGIGCDQLIVLERSATADLAMRIWNADGSSAGACGNAARAVALLLGQPARVETIGGTIAVDTRDGAARVDMGRPRFGWDEIPLAYPVDTADLPTAWDALDHGFAVNVGNPHVVFFPADAEAVALDRLGLVIEHDPLFPDRVNVGVARVTGPSALTLRVWERGAGLTRACGTGACAAAVAALSRRLVAAPVAVALPGGTLEIDWSPGGTITMRGLATHVFTGEAELATFA